LGLVLDTGVLLAAIEPRDDHHRACAGLIGQASEARVVPAPVLVELEYLLRQASDPEAFRAFLDDSARGAFTIEPLLREDYARVGELLQTYADLRLGFVDAAVLAVTERLREPKLATLDHRHFRILRPRHVEALELLPS
jgi:predicted nucleic acid-binding protein